MFVLKKLQDNVLKNTYVIQKFKHICQWSIYLKKNATEKKFVIEKFTLINNIVPLFYLIRAVPTF